MAKQHGRPSVLYQSEHYDRAPGLLVVREMTNDAPECRSCEAAIPAAMQAGAAA